MDIHAASFTKGLAVVTDAATYGTTILTVASATRATVGSITFTFSNVRDGMKLYLACTAWIQSDASSVAAVNLRVNYAGTIVDLNETEVQNTTAGNLILASMLCSYTIAHAGATGSLTAIVSLVGRRVV